MRNSYFDGGLVGLVINRLYAVVITVLSIGILLPWALCIIARWESKHTVIEGRRLAFDGTGTQLFGNWIKWWFLTLITFGIYGFWVGIKLRQWKTKHTYFVN